MVGDSAELADQKKTKARLAEGARLNWEQRQRALEEVLATLIDVYVCTCKHVPLTNGANSLLFVGGNYTENSRENYPWRNVRI